MESRVIQTDPEFYRKVVALMQTTKHKLRIVVTGDTVHFYVADKHIGDMNTAMFFKSEPNDIWKILGVSNANRKGYLL